MGARGETRRYQQRRRELLTFHLMPITRIEQAELASSPDISALSMPRGKLTAARPEAAARGMAQVSAPHAAIFIAAGLPADVIARLTAATDAVQASYDARVRRKGERRSATAGLARHLREGRQQLQILVGLLRHEPAIDAALLADWQASTRIPRRTRRTATTPVAFATAVLLPPAPAQVALPAPALMKLLTTGTPPAMLEQARRTSLIRALLQPFRRTAE